MIFPVFFWFFFILSTVSTEDCLINCFCTDYRAECTISSCLDDINTEFDEIVINGVLCNNHKYTLTHIIQDSLIILKDDVCGEIPNCQ